MTFGNLHCSEFIMKGLHYVLCTLQGTENIIRLTQEANKLARRQTMIYCVSEGNRDGIKVLSEPGERSIS